MASDAGLVDQDVDFLRDGKRERIFEQLDAKCEPVDNPLYNIYVAFLASQGYAVADSGKARDMAWRLNTDWDLSLFYLEEVYKQNSGRVSRHGLDGTNRVESDSWFMRDYGDRLNEVYPAWHNDGLDINNLRRLVFGEKETETAAA